MKILWNAALVRGKVLLLIIGFIYNTCHCTGQKEILTIAWHPEDKKTVPFRMINEQARWKVESELRQAYAKVHNLLAPDAYEVSCPILVHEIALEYAMERVKNLTDNQLKEYYGKIKQDHESGKGGYAEAIVFLSREGKFPSLDQISIYDIMNALRSLWTKQKETKLETQDINELVKNKKYREIFEQCKKQQFELNVVSESIAAVGLMLNKQAEDLLKKMTDKQIQEYYDSRYHGIRAARDKRDWVLRSIRHDLEKDLIQKLAHEYTIKSDDPDILQAVKDIQAGKVD